MDAFAQIPLPPIILSFVYCRMTGDLQTCRFIPELIQYEQRGRTQGCKKIKQDGWTC